MCYDSTALAMVHSSRVVNIKNSFIDRFFQYWGTFFLLKVSSVQHKTQVTTFPYGCFRGMQFQIESNDYGVKIFAVSRVPIPVPKI